MSYVSQGVWHGLDALRGGAWCWAYFSTPLFPFCPGINFYGLVMDVQRSQRGAGPLFCTFFSDDDLLLLAGYFGRMQTIVWERDRFCVTR